MNGVIWGIGFILYRILMNVDIPLGNTLPDMVITIVICILARKCNKDRKNRFKRNGNSVLTFPFSFDRTCSDLQKRGGKMNADAWKRGKSL